ncbi:2-C-methyl-D-erythritol 2,4-cyclodiphosphate synthase [bacterium]|nr:2-C-methyl-D-erythritol 2,4-cyclodiphosphate synthase [bacterium]
MPDKSFRIGIGYDIHRLEDGRNLIVGGVNIPYEKGLLGHSDADVLVHAIIDAMLGALALPDIGTLFSDTDERYRNADSMKLLKNVSEIIICHGYHIGNLDTNIIAQAPKMMPHIPQMKKKLSEILGIGIGDISVKAKTKENLDSVGEGRAIEAQAVVLLYKD